MSVGIPVRQVLVISQEQLSYGAGPEIVHDGIIIIIIIVVVVAAAVGPHTCVGGLPLVVHTIALGQQRYESGTAVQTRILLYLMGRYRSHESR